MDRPRPCLAKPWRATLASSPVPAFSESGRKLPPGRSRGSVGAGELPGSFHPGRNALGRRECPVLEVSEPRMERWPQRQPSADVHPGREFVRQLSALPADSNAIRTSARLTDQWVRASAIWLLKPRVVPLC